MFNNFFILLFLSLYSSIAVFAQTQITDVSGLNSITANGNYIITSDIDASGFTTSIASFTGTLTAQAKADGTFPVITGLRVPLFTTATGATISNIMLDDVTISQNGKVGAIAATADGATRIYNCGILSGSVGSTGTSTSKNDTDCCGGIVGSLDGTARVINCFSYATITAGNRVGGIVGYNNATTNSTSITTMIMNCMFYGDITGGYIVCPIYGGNIINNLSGSNGLNTFNYYAYSQLSTANSKKIDYYNCALAMEERFLNRFELYRLFLNSNKKLAAYYASTASVTVNPDDIAKWVLETADRSILEPKPYPVLRPNVQGRKYPSIINYDIANAPDSANVGRNKGGKLGKTLKVNISIGTGYPTDAAITTSTLYLQRTDKDFDHFNFNYDKVQLPYYNDVGTKNYTGNKVVTGWKITSIDAIDGDPYTLSNYPATGIKDYPNHNYADRKSSNKDLYSVSGRVFAQGAYFDVPYGVESITIEPYWGKAAYLSDEYLDVVCGTDYKTASVTALGSIYGSNGTSVSINGSSQKVYTTISNALGALSGITSPTVYDYAVVLVGNYHQSSVPSGATKPFTLMSIDLDKDNEPDYSFIYCDGARSKVSPIRFDFLNIIGTAQAQKPNGASQVRNAAIFKTQGWFEITNTALMYFSQFEYENKDGVTKAESPLILQGGVFDQFTSTQRMAVDGKTIYIHLGGNVWMKEFSMGTHSDGKQSTPHVPVSVTGGDFEGFYLTGTYNANANVRSDNAECYISGGRFGEMAGAGLEQINGNVRWQIYNADITSFFGGGTNDTKPILGTITTDIFNSHVGTFCGGPKFGNMASGKAVITTADGCTFDNFYGAGYGGNSFSRKKYFDAQNPNWNNIKGNYTNDKGLYYDGETTNSGDDGHPDWGKKGKGVATDFDYEFFVWTSGATGGRFFVKFVSFSLAECNDVTSELTNCTINGNYYGGGNLGKVTGTATSVLDNCNIYGNVFGGGFSATIPEVPVRTGTFTKNPNFNGSTGMFEPGELSDTVHYEWKHVDSYPTNGDPGIVTENGKNYVVTTADLTTLGQVGKTDLTIKGDTYVAGDVFGGGDQSETTGDTEIEIQATDNNQNYSISNLFGGGNVADVGGNVQVTLTTGTILHNVYGGGALAHTNINNNKSPAPNPLASTTVNLNGGMVQGDVYGGGLGDANTAALVWGDATVTLNGTTLQDTSRIFGGNNLNGTPKGHIKVDIKKTIDNNQTIDLAAVFGGGNMAAYVPANANDYAEVNIGETSSTNRLLVGSVYGGGNMANVEAGTQVTLASGNITEGVYGGCNSSGSVGAVTVNLNGGTVGASNNRADVYGGGYGSATTTTGNIGVTLNGTTVYGDIYGGSALGGVNASALNTTTVTLASATLYGSVFGGGKGDNSTTAISNGNAIVNINIANTNLDGIYGGANVRGNIKGNINVNINANVGAQGDSLDIFGGGYGAATNTEGNVTVTIGSLDGSKNPTIYGDIYGGSALGNVNNASTDTTKVDFLNGTLHGNLYGGGLGDRANLGTGHSDVAAKVFGKVLVNIGADGQSNCAIDLGNSSIFGCNNTNGSPQDSVTVNIYCTGHNTTNAAGYTEDDGTNGAPTYAINQVFGGGNQANYAPENGNANSNKRTTVNIHGCTNTIRRVFAGGNAAAAHGVVSVIDGGRFDYVFGGGNGESQAADIGAGGTDLTVHGGNINNLFGGSNTSGTISGTMSTTIDRDGPCQDQGSMYIAEFFCGNNLANIGTQDNPVNINAVIGCGTRFGDVYGGCNQATIYGNVQLTIEGGVIDTVYAGSKGTINDAANINGNVTLNIYGGTIGAAFGGSNKNGNITGAIQVNMDWSQGPAPNDCSDGKSIDYVYGGSNLATYHPTASGNYPQVNILHGTVNHSVFGGGKGASAIVTSNPVVTIGDAVAGHCAVVTENVFGGGDAAPVSGKTKVIYNDTHSNSHVANLFGGGNEAGVSDSATVILTAGKVTTGVYGGCNSKGTVAGAIVVFINGGTVGTDSLLTANVHGGGYGYQTGTGDNVTVIVGDSVSTPIIWGDVYGGSALGNVNDNAAELTKVWLKSGTINGSLYGGGLGDANHPAYVNGAVQVIVDGGSVDTTANARRTTGAVFGCNNVNGTPKSTVEVIINSTAATVINNNVKTYALQGVYGGGNLAHYDPTNRNIQYPTVTINGCETSIKDIYGGGNAAAVPYTHVTVYGGDIDRVFAGGNGESGTPAHIGYINTNATPSSDDYGTGTALATILGGTINQVFGGSNANGIIRGGIVVNVDWADDNTCDNKYLGSVFGGGNQAPYGTAGSDYPQVNIYNARIANNVFGGGLGSSATVTGNPHVTIGSTTGSKKVIIAGDVYGGGDAAAVVGTPVVNVVSNVNDTIRDVYGGGNAADVSATDVTIDGGNIGMVFGGGHGNKNISPQKEANVSGAVSLTITGGTIDKVFGGSNSKGSIGGTIIVNVEKDEDSDPMHIGELYGGGNEANGKAGTLNIVCTGTSTEGIGDVYGGANKADISNSISLNITGGSIQRVFGGNNTSGTISGNIAVTVNHNTQNPCGYTYLGSIFGGGNQAGYSGTPVVTITNGTVNHSVYGGGNQADVAGATVNMNGGSVLEGIYGGCNTSGTVTGAIAVNINAGTVGANGTPANIHGGGYGQNTGTSGNVEVTIGSAVGAQSYPTIYGDVYGGSALGKVNGTALNNALHTYVTLNSGTINGSLYGGALGNDTTAANVYAPVTVTVNGGTVTQGVYGCNNVNGAPQGAVTVHINGTDQPQTGYAIGKVFGGGNQAAYNGTPLVNIHHSLTGNQNANPNRIEYVYGGGNQATVTGTNVTVYGGSDIGYVFGGGYGASVTQDGTNVNIYGGNIGQVFGGNDQSGSVTGNISVTVDKQTEQGHQSCPMNIDEVYGGGNLAASQAGSLTIGATGGETEGIGYVFGGANNAHVTGNITLNITGGRITNLFGGNNTGNVVEGNIEINVNWDNANGPNDSKHLNNVYGGGQKADVTGNTVININKGTVSNDVYGGGMEGDVTGSVTVNIGHQSDSTIVVIGHDVYGGGALANTNTANITLGNTSKETEVNLRPGATIYGDVYGGGLGRIAGQGLDSVEAIVYGNVSVYQLGAVLVPVISNEIAQSGRIFGCNNINGTPKGHVLVYVGRTNKHSSSDQYALAAVYGGGNNAEYNPYRNTLNDSDSTEVVIDGCNNVSIHSVYGGGNAASTPATSVVINGAKEILYVFGGGNGAGKDNPGANVGYHYYDEDEFGGGTPEDVARRRNLENKLVYGSGIASTKIYGGTIHNVYGGSNTKGNIRQASVAMLDELSTCQLVLDGIYGGGREAYMEGKTVLEMGCITGMDEIYGGSEKADVGDDIILNITSGHYGKVFGGNNKGGRIFGTITVNIEQTGCLPITIDELYLGGNNAPYSVYGYGDSLPNRINFGTEQQPEMVLHYELNEKDENHTEQTYDDPILHIRSFASIGKVFGGGNGSLATMVGNPIVEINVTQGWVNGEYTGSDTTYRDYVDTPMMLSEGVIDTVYGGGNAAEVRGNTVVLIGDSINQDLIINTMNDLYGSIDNNTGLKRSNIKMVKANDNGIKTITYSVVDNNGNPVEGKDPLTVKVKQKANGATITGNVYGGGNKADVTGSTYIQLGPPE